MMVQLQHTQGLSAILFDKSGIKRIFAGDISLRIRLVIQGRIRIVGIMYKTTPPFLAEA